MTHHTMRKNKLPKPGLQFRLSMFFVSIASVAAIFQVFLINRAIMDIARVMPNDNQALLDALPDVFYSGLTWTVLVLLPVMLMFGMFVTFRIAGPVYRMEQHLLDIADGKDVTECRLRERDELHGLCDALNQALTAVQARQAQGPTAATTSEQAETEVADPVTH